MICCKEESLWRFIEHAESARNAHIDVSLRLAMQLKGGAFNSADANEWAENPVYEFLSLIVPRIVFDNPKFFCHSDAGPEAQMVAGAIETALNRLVKDLNLRDDLQLLATDIMMGYAFGMVTREPLPGYDPSEEGRPYRPVMVRIPAAWGFFDPMALTFQLCRFVGHQIPTDKPQLLEAAKKDKKLGWDIKKLEALTTTHEIHPDQAKVRDQPPESNQILIKEIWVPDSTEDVSDHPGPSEGFHGTIYTLGVGGGAGTGSFVRKPRAYFGPKTGPYFMGGIHTVPNSVFPLSPLVATMDQQQQLMRISKAMAESAARYRRFIVVNEKDRKLAQKLQSAKHDTVVPVPGFDGTNISHQEVGGITAQMIEQRRSAREELMTSLGMSDALRGNVTGVGTATENTIAEQASTVRLAYMKQQFGNVVRDIGRKFAWFMHADDETMMPQGANEEGVREWFLGGTDGGVSYDDLEIDLDVASMERMNEGKMQQSFNQAAQFIINTAPLIPQTPWVNWSEFYSIGGKVWHMPGMDKLVDPAFAAAMSGGDPEQTPRETPKLRLSGDNPMTRLPVSAYGRTKRESGRAGANARGGSEGAAQGVGSLGGPQQPNQAPSSRGAL